ncbi:MAG: hypothetical protein COB35_04865 [Gammaproteobacteria bacterium]|nr:MAG: hypothetical protein COB35_04865 [Gammaproteobacteria bacterium]
MMDKKRLIQLVHIAATQLGHDTELSKQIKFEVTGKSSCKYMTVAELNALYKHYKKSGFKPVSKKPFVKRDNNKKADMLDKLRQLWVEMNAQGFLHDGSFAALEKWAANQSKRLNNGVAITRLEWLPRKQQHALIEQLKQWQQRLIKQAQVS